VEMLSGSSPFAPPGATEMQIYQNITSYNGTIDAYPEHTSAEGRDFIQNLLHKDPEKRLGFKDQDIMNHPWFFDFEWNELKLRHLPSPLAMSAAQRSSEIDRKASIETQTSQPFDNSLFESW
jgi:serine/threonine protein kinase